MTMKLEPQWIVGFVDGDGCFAVYVRTAADGQTPVSLQPAFKVTQHERDIEVLYALKAHFGCGQVQHKGKNVFDWYVRKLDHLLTEIIPFFEKHALKTQKNIEFRRFRRICVLMRDKVHRNPEGFEKCVALARGLRLKDKVEIEVDQGRVQLLPKDVNMHP